MLEARVPALAVASLIKDAMLAVGMPDVDAAKCAELMLEADLVGADAHGVFRLPQYVLRIKACGVNPKANITVEKTAPATAMVDGDNGMGHLVMQRAADTAIALAKETGVAWVGARRSNHAGAAGVYAAMALPHDMSASKRWWRTPTTCRSGAAQRTSSAPTRSPSRCRPGRSRRWCSILPPRLSPTAR